MRKAEQRGVALLFALGMLTLLLVSGMAFVANALSAHKIAANNSGRSQARIFAQSALNRALASIMLYQYQVQKTVGEFPENFDCIKSYGEVKSNGNTNKITHKDGLITTDDEDSLMILPEDDSIVSKSIARQFNTMLKQDWEGRWVYFFNHITGDEREIIGRAAWRVVSHSPQILAPVFLSGHLPTDGTPGWTPAEFRWGREIDEVYTGNSSSIFLPVRTNIKASDGSFVMKDYETVFNKVGINDGEDDKKRWVESWFIPDAESDNFVDRPTEIIPEIYSYKKSETKLVQLMRFNISELSDITQYGVAAAADPWYARFGIDSTAAGADTNSDNFINNTFTIDSPEAAVGDKFDYKLDKGDRPSLPFLRRIGNADADKGNNSFKSGTDVDMTAWRKQIAANFNDYCDADNIPTSDVSAEKWMDEMAATYIHPSYTGNEKTPYLYELGFRLGIYPEKDTKANLTAAGATVAEATSAAAGNIYSGEITAAYVGVAPIVKLANVYNFDPAAFSFSNFNAGIDLGAFEIKFKPRMITFNVRYTDADGNLKTTEDIKSNDDTVDALNFSEVTGTLEDNILKTSTVQLTDNGKINNSAGANPYPLMIPAELSETTEKTAKLTLADGGKFTFTASLDTLNQILTDDIPADATVNKITLKSIDAVEVTALKLNVKRAFLAATLNGKNIGLDYVKQLPELTFTIAEGQDLKLAPATADGKIPGLYIGGIRNYDPRQNLNPDDWYQKLVLVKSEDIRTPVKDSALTVMSVSTVSDDTRSGLVNAVNTGDTTDGEPDKFNPAFNSDVQDLERTTEPGWSDTAAGSDDTKRISTAFIRNAPMMSPWEIGFIHRGIRWQTINLKKSGDPDATNDNTPISLDGHKPHGNSWTLSGTRYAGGDGAILDQIKMTDKCATYGKINVNRLRTNNELFKPELDLNIAKALFENIRVGENINQFFNNSKRSGDYLNINHPTGTPIGTFSESNFNVMTTSRTAQTSRAQFISWSNGHLENAFGAAATVAPTDAACEEIIGKTVNLLCAENSSPSQIKVVVVAQAIRDVGGTQIRHNADGTTTTGSCNFGQFDKEFDEVTGEVKMLVTVDRNINTGRLFVSRIDYLE